MKRDSVMIVSAYAVAALLSTIIACLRLKCWESDFAIPFRYSGDALWQAAKIKGMIETGWIFENPLLGMPTGMALYDYPVLNTITYIILKPAALLIKDYAILMNGYFIATFPLVALSAMFVLRRFGISYCSAIIGGVLYSILPYHFLRAQSHLGLIGYYIVPLSILMAHRLHDIRHFESVDCNEKSRVFMFRQKTFVSSGICLLIGLSNLYYAFFSVYLLVISGLSAAISKRRIEPFASAILFAVFIGIVAGAVNLPCLQYQTAHGPNPSPMSRTADESLTHGLELTSLIIPKAGSGFAFVDELRERHLDAHDDKKWAEGRFAYIGIVGVMGLLVLIVELLKTGVHQNASSRLRRLSVNTLSLMALGVVGGMGYFLSLLGFAQIRGYNRVSIFIAYICIAAFFLTLDSLGARFRKLKGERVGFAMLLIAILIIGARDQTTEPWCPEYEKLGRQYSLDRGFVREIEQRIPPQSMIFQLPHLSFLGSAPPHRMSWHDHLRPYLHSKNLRWSYGAVVGRSADLWANRTLRSDYREQIESLCVMGFAGLLVDKFGYSDYGASLISGLEDIVHSGAVESQDGRFAFLDISAHADSIRADLGIDHWRRRRAYEQLLIAWRKGFYDLQPQSQSCWCSPYAELWIHNVSDRKIRCQLVMAVRTPHIDSSHLNIQSTLASKELTIHRKRTEIRMSLEVPPGDHPIRFHSDASDAAPRKAKEFRAFRVIDVSITQVDWAD